MDNKFSDYAVLIVAGGHGLRMGANLPKQYLPLLGQSVLGHALRAFAGFADVYVAHHPDHAALCQTAAGDRARLLPVAGATRQETVRRALHDIAAKKAPRFILVHDAARPCVDGDTIAGVMAALQNGTRAATPAVALPDTLRRLHSDGRGAETIDRTGMHAVQTPQGFVFADLLQLHGKYAETTVADDAGLFETAGIAVAYTPGSRANIKITHAQDLADAAAALSAARGDVRSASGYDVHVFTDATPDRPLRLGGISIAHDKTLLGHSDADALLHAITDALLGCIAAEDIGFHFKPSDARWKDADSTKFLAHARDLVAQAGGIISHIDATVVCEAPRIGPHRAAMQQKIAETLQIDQGRVSIKATTSEGLGFTGRREGLAAYATATVRLPFSFSVKDNSHAAA